MNKFHLAILAFLLSGAFALIGANSANALYGSFHTADQLNVVSPNGLHSADVSHDTPNSWQILRQKDSTRKRCDYQTQLTTAIESGSIAVTQYIPQTLTGNQGLTFNLSQSWQTDYPRSFVAIIFSTSNDQTADILIGDDYTDVLLQTTYSNSYYSASLFIDNDGTYIFNCGRFDSNLCQAEYTTHTSTCPLFMSLTNWIGYAGSGWSYPDYQTYIYYTTFEVQYPPDWDQPLIPTVPPDPPVTPVGNDQTPNLNIQMAQDFLATIQDTNFNTFDPVPFVCSDELTPILHYEIWDRLDPDDPDEDLLFTGTENPTVSFTYQFARYDQDKYYRVVSWYECFTGEPSFEHSSYVDFMITRNGMLGQDLFESCMTETFPFMDMGACYNNLSNILQLMVNGKITFPSWTFDPSCTNLNTFDDWMNLPSGYQVCPQFPPSVRNAITPFVAFMLGIVTVGFINRHNRDVRGQGF